MLSIKNLSVQFKRYSSGMDRYTMDVVSHLDLFVNEGEIIAVVGSSGAGKSLFAHAVLGILPDNAIVKGEIRYKGKFLTEKRKAELRGKEIVLVPQSVEFLNPLCRVGKQVERAAIRSGKSKKEASDVTRQTFQRYSLKNFVRNCFPFQVSGGMARRVLVATSTVGDADLIIADEPTNGLDQEAAVLSLSHFRQLADQGKAVVIITHDLNAALSVADKVAVFYKGCTLEIAQASDFNGVGRLRHPYSQALWDSLPQHEFNYPPAATNAINASGCDCVYRPQCHLNQQNCQKIMPEIRKVNGGYVRCYEA